MPTHAEYITRLEIATARLQELLLWHPHPWLRDLIARKLTEAEQLLVDHSFTGRKA